MKFNAYGARGNRNIALRFDHIQRLIGATRFDVSTIFSGIVRLAIGGEVEQCPFY